MKRILGISAYYHDAAACLIEDGVIVSAAQEERFTRIKQDDAFPIKAIEYCLDSMSEKGGTLDAVVFYEKPIDHFARILDMHLCIAPRGLGAFLKAMPEWALRKLWVKYQITNDLEKLGLTNKTEIFFTEHHESHAASAFYPSPFEDAAIVTLDGVGEWPTMTIGTGEGNTITNLREHNFPHSIGLLYSAFTYYLGFTVNSDEYKIMGLAPYGEPKYVDRIFDDLVKLNDDGSFLLNMKYFNFLGGLTMTNSAFDTLFEEPVRTAESDITQHTMDIARSIQDAIEIIIFKIVQHAHKLTGKENLCLAGGVALNCVANGKLLKEGPFKNIWVAPAAGDAGGAIGAALSAWYNIYEGVRDADGNTDQMQGSFLGPEYSDDEIETFLSGENASYEKIASGQRAEAIASALTDGKIIGLFQGRMEFGPRALGHRSIIADPRVVDMQRRINQKIKFRESFRPFAPAVLEECCAEYFDLDYPSPYMLFTAPVTKAMRTEEDPDNASESLPDRLARQRSSIPGVTHVDYSARIQTVAESVNPEFHEILQAFHKKTGCGVLINTSFNVRGEPIVCTPRDAYNCFMKTDMDVLVLESFVLRKDSE